MHCGRAARSARQRRVTESAEGGRWKVPSKLGVELTSLTLGLDGQQVCPYSSDDLSQRHTSRGVMQAQWRNYGTRRPPSARPRNWGRGAAIGEAPARAGSRMLLTRGRPTVIYPESALTSGLYSSAAFTVAALSQLRFSKRGYGRT